MREREAFQELDYRAVFGSIAKWVTEIDDPARIPELVSRAFYTATNGRPGPVVVALPEDMLEERVTVADAPAFEPIETSPGAAEIDRMRQLLAEAQRPIVIAGGSRWSEAASAALMRFAGRFDIPVATSFRRTHVMDPLHPSYAGDLASGPNPKLLARVKAAVLAEFRKQLARDRTRVTVSGFSQLGLVELTRKRTRESLAHMLCEPCPTCEGRGQVKTARSVCYDILREILREARQFNPKEFRIVASAAVVEMMLDEESPHLAGLSDFIGKPISLSTEPSLNPEQYDIVLM